MSGFKPLKPQNVDVSKVEIAPLKKLDNGANIAYLNYEGKPIYITTQELDVPFDGQWWPTDDNNGKWSVKVNLRKGDSDHLITLLQSMDSQIKQTAMENSVAWFKKRNMSADTVDTLYTPMLKEDIDPDSGEPTGKYPPSMAFKIVKRDGNVACKVFGDNKMEFNVTDESSDNFVNMTDLLKKGSKVKLLLRCNGLWVANGKFGCTWRAEQMKVTRAATFDDYAFDDSDEEEVEKIDQNFVESESEEDTGADDSMEVEDEPKKVAKKPRKVSKK
jgi:hypothetical protein